MIVTAVAGATRAKISIDVDHPTPIDSTTPITVPMQILNGNLQGPYSMSDTARLNRMPSQINLVKTSADFFVGIELHEENDMHRYFLGQLKASDADWALHEGDGGNHLLYRPSKWVPVRAATNLSMPGSRSMSIFPVRHLATGFETNIVGAHARADDTDGTSREAERKQQFTFVAQQAAALTYVVVAGDWNFKSSSIAASRQIFASAGLYGLQTREPGLPYGTVDSYSGGAGGRWIDDIFTRNAQTVSGSAGVLAGDASDHYLWVKTNVTFSVKASVPTKTMTLYRETSSGRAAVPAMVNVVASTTIVTDHAVPLNRDVTYVAQLSDGTLTAAAPIRVNASLPLLTHPVTGQVAACIIQDWPEKTLETPSTLVRIPGRRSPVVLTDIEGMATSSPVLMTTTRAQELALEDLVADGDVLLLRTLCPEVPDAYLAITARTPRRFTQKPSSTTRLHTLTVQEIGAEDMTELGLGDTLGDIAAALPSGTLGNLAALFPGGTLLDIANADWTGQV